MRTCLCNSACTSPVFHCSCKEVPVMYYYTQYQAYCSTVPAVTYATLPLQFRQYQTCVHCSRKEVPVMYYYNYTQFLQTCGASLVLQLYYFTSFKVSCFTVPAVKYWYRAITIPPVSSLCFKLPAGKYWCCTNTVSPTTMPSVSELLQIRGEVLLLHFYNSALYQAYVSQFLQTYGEVLVRYYYNLLSSRPMFQSSCDLQ
ncbi:hypothetical protein NDU88_001132 [Pleurodeles waltl]|uniref:Uncharacterized protein n=1 Tax=Pleurodeles waltl TaxID=8319 RepID=A0AAV7M4E6_PLEWA|nr:hypothetical protein NDU88_001132 [Pleurodeles waltl]